MKPEIGTTVYCIYDDGIFVDTVGYLGNESFIVESFGGSTYEDSWEWFFEDYAEEWFVDLEDAKEVLIARYEEMHNQKFKVEQTEDTWYQLEEVEE